MSNNPRIIAGIAKNRKLKVADASRPVTDRIKQSIFDILNPKIPGAEVLDLFAGSGSFGIEALSRGAKLAIFIESDYKAARILEENVETTGFKEQSKVLEKESHKFLWQREDKFDLIFCDPPFPNATEFAYYLLAKHLKPEGVAMVRIPSKLNLEDLNTKGELEVLYTAQYGDSRVFFFGTKVNLACSNHRNTSRATGTIRR